MIINRTHRKGATSLLALCAAAMLPAPVHGEVAMAEIAPKTIPFEDAAVEAPDVVQAPVKVLEQTKEDAELAAEAEIYDEGTASYYGAELAGNRTASGERFNPSALTAAHRTLPLGTKVRVTNQANGKSVVVRINDRGPFAKARIIDLSHGAAKEISMVRAGTARVTIELI